ncbi:MAG TPA: hypothetical protein ENK97_01135 [Campylobacteraceae bacterium]|nr:hypothetical protein [Campylobacteraceae bacterium]
MAKKKEIQVEEVQNLDQNILAQLVYQCMQEDKRVYDRVEKYILRNDPDALIKSIKKEIASIRRGRKFIDYYHAFDFAKKIADIVENIETMVENSKNAAALYKELILTDTKVYNRSDDSSGAIQMSYHEAMGGWKNSLEPLSEEEIYRDIQELLLCEDFGPRSVLSEKIPASVLRKIYEEHYERYRKHVEALQSEFDSFNEFSILHECAHYLNQPDLFIKALELKNTITEYDLLDVAKEYRAINEASQTLEWLNKIERVQSNMTEEYFTAKIWALETLGRKREALELWKSWYETTHSPKILKNYLERLEDAEREQAREQALREAQKLSFSKAVHLFSTLEEKELAARYILEHHKALATPLLYGKELNALVKWLSEEYPDAAILLLRDAVEKTLESAQSKNYPWAIRHLKKAFDIEEAHPNHSWQIASNREYVTDLLQRHGKKYRFVHLLEESFPHLL